MIRPPLRLLLIGTVLMGIGGQVFAESKTIVMQNMAFSPPVLSVSRGDIVAWRNQDLVPHNATASDGSFKSIDIPANGEWKLTTDKKGEFSYICTLHPTMKGKLIVK
jgi:plastocyanin